MSLVYISIRFTPQICYKDKYSCDIFAYAKRGGTKPTWTQERKVCTSFLLEEMLINYKYTMYYLISSVTEIDWNELIKLKKSVMACDKYFCGNVLA